MANIATRYTKTKPSTPENVNTKRRKMKAVMKYSILDQLDQLIFESGGHNFIAYIELTNAEYNQFILELSQQVDDYFNGVDNYNGIPIKLKQET